LHRASPALRAVSAQLVPIAAARLSPLTRFPHVGRDLRRNGPQVRGRLLDVLRDTNYPVDQRSSTVAWLTDTDQPTERLHSLLAEGLVTQTMRRFSLPASRVTAQPKDSTAWRILRWPRREPSGPLLALQILFLVPVFSLIVCSCRAGSTSLPASTSAG